jgi:hypothetical protein
MATENPGAGLDLNGVARSFKGVNKRDALAAVEVRKSLRVAILVI